MPDTGIAVTKVVISCYCLIQEVVVNRVLCRLQEQTAQQRLHHNSQRILSMLIWRILMQVHEVRVTTPWTVMHTKRTT